MQVQAKRFLEEQLKKLESAANLLKRAGRNRDAEKIEEDIRELRRLINQL